VPPLATSSTGFHLFGTDYLGRDVLSRTIHGAQIALYVSVVAVLLSGLVGTTIGIVIGYFGGLVDQIVMRISDAWISLPTVAFAILLAAVKEPSATNIIVVATIVFWTRYARIARAETLSLRNRDFVKLAITAGASHAWIMSRHILPNVLNSIVVLATLLVGNVILTEAILSFLGVGVPPPHPAWGSMLSESRTGIMTFVWWPAAFPGLAIMAVVGAANILGDWIRVRLDPRLQEIS